MRGSPVGQVVAVLNKINAIGSSRHQAKQQARNAGAKTSREVSTLTGIYSHATMLQYRKVAIDLMHFVKDSCGVKDITKITETHITQFLAYKITGNVKYSTFKTYCAALGKLAVALNLIDHQHRDWSQAITAGKKVARQKLSSDYQPRAYADPRAIIANLNDADFRLVAEIQYLCGTRVSETTHIKQEHLLDGNTLALTNTKGGRPRRITLPPEIYHELETHLRQHDGIFAVDRQAYRSALHHAATMSGQPWHGTHGLRWCYVQKRLSDLQQEGTSYDSALAIISKEIGHTRAEITEWYAR